MLSKIFGHKKSISPPLNHHHTPPWMVAEKGFRTFTSPLDRELRALKIVHAGGSAEYYYMAIPAAKIIEKYPSFALATPEVFRRPWDSIVRPEKILIPGQKFYIVPRHTVKKLKRRIKKNNGGSVEINVLRQKDKDHLSTSSIMAKSGLKKKARNHRVRFFGIDAEMKESDSSIPSDKKKPEKSVASSKKSVKAETDAGKKTGARYASAWEPSLTSINETSGPDD